MKKSKKGLSSGVTEHFILPMFETVKNAEIFQVFTKPYKKKIENRLQIQYI